MPQKRHFSRASILIDALAASFGLECAAEGLVASAGAGRTDFDGRRSAFVLAAVIDAVDYAAVDRVDGRCLLFHVFMLILSQNIRLKSLFFKLCPFLTEVFRGIIM